MLSVMKSILLIIISFLLITACTKDGEISMAPESEKETIQNQLPEDYVPLPEKEIAVSTDERVYAQYTLPTERYAHGILGDKIEAGQLLVSVDSVFNTLTLANEYVFEDIRPRLYDVDGDGELEFITIRTKVSQGAGIAIYKLIDKELQEYAFVPEIGTANRWLNIVAINDLDNDGNVELVWIETPHIGGILKVAKIKAGKLEVLDQLSGYSNHAIGQRNLCLSVLTQQQNKKVFYVPTQNRNKISGFSFENNKFQIIEEITQHIDFSQSLLKQYTFTNTIQEEDNCINPN